MPRENPRRRRRRTPPRYNSGPKRGQFKPKRARNVRRTRKATKKKTTRRRRRNLSLMTVGNPRRSSVARRRKRRTSRPRKRRYTRRKNPALMGIQLPDFGKVLWGVGGYAGAQALPSIIMPAQYAAGGAIAYALELAGAVGASMLAKMIGGQEAMRAALTGGGIRVAVHVLEETGMLAKLPGLSGVPAINAGYPGVGPGQMGAFLDAGVTPAFPEELGGFMSDYETHYLSGYVDAAL